MKEMLLLGAGFFEQYLLILFPGQEPRMQSSYPENEQELLELEGVVLVVCMSCHLNKKFSRKT